MVGPPVWHIHSNPTGWALNDGNWPPVAGFATNTLDLVPDYTILSEMTYDELIAVTEAHHLTILSILARSTGRIILLRPHAVSYTHLTLPTTAYV